MSSVYSNILTIAAASSVLFHGGVLAPNGNVIFTPSGSGNVGVFNPTLITYSNITGPGITAASFWGSVLLPTGNVVFAPNQSSNIGMFNPVSLAYSNYYTILAGTASGFQGGVLTPNGNVAFITGSASNPTIGLFNPTNSTYSAKQIGVLGQFFGGCLSPSGIVICTPSGANSNIGLYDPTLQTYTNVAYSGMGPSVFRGSTLLPDGRVVLGPYNSGNVGVISTMVPAPREFCLSPFFNKF